MEWFVSREVGEIRHQRLGLLLVVLSAVVCQASGKSCHCNTAIPGIPKHISCHVSAPRNITTECLSSIRRDAVFLAFARQELTFLPAGIFTNLSLLDGIDVHGNQLTSLPSGLLSGLTALRSLVARSNQLTSIPADLFAGLTALEHIDLSSNSLSSLPLGLFSGLSAVNTIRVDANKLTSLPSGIFFHLPRLETLKLEQNQLTTLPANLFAGLAKMQSLYLQNNMLALLPADIFANVSAVQTINLSNNRLVSLPPGIFSNLPQLNFNFLSANPWHCSPSTCQLLSINIRDIPTCSTPSAFNRTAFQDLNCYTNECLLSKGCDQNATCTRNSTAFMCQCNDGYSGDGKTCQDVDECLTECSNVAQLNCVNTFGSYWCICRVGYTLSKNGTSCQDINECLGGNNCHQLATCINTIGSYMCQCKTGFTGNGKHCEGVTAAAASGVSNVIVIAVTVGAITLQLLI